jgi:hypothetical protein
MPDARINGHAEATSLLDLLSPEVNHTGATSVGEYVTRTFVHC